MVDTSLTSDLKQIGALKKKITWGEVPAVFQLTYYALSELDGILTHGFESAFKTVLNKTHWNLKLLEAYQDSNGNLQVKHKPQITLKHVYNEESYELHCFPMVNGERIHYALHESPDCPFVHWTPETMQMLFRVKNLVNFISYAFRSGDEADLALIKFAHAKVNELVNRLSESFEIVDVIGYNVAQFCKELNARKNSGNSQELFTN